MAQPFIFLGGAPGETPDQIDNNRKIADALLGGIDKQAQPHSFLAALGQGFNDLGSALAVHAGRASVPSPDGLFGTSPDAAPDGTATPPATMGDAGAPAASGGIADYITQAATARGIDPRIALAVAKSEGLNSYTGDANSSFGPFQLHYGGVAPGGNRVPGLGDTFTKNTGLDARDPSTVHQQVDFALDQAAKGGWGPWHGWSGDPRAGLAGARSAGIAKVAAAMAPTQVASLDPSAGISTADVGGSVIQPGGGVNYPATFSPSDLNTNNQNVQQPGPSGPVTHDGANYPMVMNPAGISTADVGGSVIQPPGQMAAAPSPAVARVAAAVPPGTVTAPPQSPAAVRVAQAMSPQLQRAIQIESNPWANPGEKAMAESIISQSLKQQDPAYQMGLQKDQLELDQLQHPKPQTTTLNGRLLQINPDGTASDITPANMSSGYRPATPDELKSYGMPDGTPLVIGPDGKPDILGSSASGGSAASQDDIAAVGDAIIGGQQPPTMTGNYRNSFPLKAYLAKKGFDLTKASMDWANTSRLMQTLNGTQQTRLRQAVGTVKETLGTVDQLAEQWKAGNFPILNAANRKLALEGVLGPDANRIATQLQTQIADVTAEMGTVIMGGNSPTDHALDLAAQNLNADWSYPTLKSAIQLARSNIAYRENSLRLVTAGIADSQYNPFQTNPGGFPPVSTAAPPPLAPGATPSMEPAPADASPAAAPAAPAAPPAKITGDDDYNALPSGAQFIGPDGALRRKP